jgi:hypothetical protein
MKENIEANRKRTTVQTYHISLIALLFLTKRIMSFLRPMLKNRCFNELEFRRMAEHAFKRRSAATTTNTVDDAKLYKTTTKNEDQFDLWSTTKMIPMKRYQFYNTLDNNALYQIVQGDLTDCCEIYKIKLQCVLIPKLLD